MTDDELMQAVRELRAVGRSPKEIAHALGVRPAAVAPLVRAIASEGTWAPEPEPMGCWVSPGWRVGLGVEGHAEWRDGGTERPEASGLVSVLVAREERKGKVSVCGYLLDVYCLGVKDALGPQRMHRGELAGFVGSYFDAWGSGPVVAPIELARQLVFGALDYGRSLGFAPHPDFERARRHLGHWEGPSAIRFGKDGTPFFTEGPYDDAATVLRRLEQAVGSGNFHFIVSAGELITP